MVARDRDKEQEKIVRASVFVCLREEEERDRQTSKQKGERELEGLAKDEN